MDTNRKNTDSYSLVLIKSLTISFILGIVLFLIFAMVLTYTDLSQNSMSVLDTIVMIVPIAIGSIIIGRKVDEKGWLNGALLGVIYALILMILSKLTFPKEFVFNFYVSMRLIIGLVTGIIGGMIGVNLK